MNNKKALMGPLNGNNGKLTIYPTYAEISRGWGASILSGMHGTKRIYFRDVGSVEFKKRGLTVGYIQFSPLGSLDSSGIWNTVNNENAITFASNNQLWKEAHNLILELVEKCKRGESSNYNSIDEIEKAYNLLQKGIITQEEFQKIKQKHI